MSAYAAGFRSWASRASGMRNVRIAGVAILVSAAIVVSAILQGDVPDVVEWGVFWMRHILHRYTYLGIYGPLYIEESGVPLPAPGDVFVMFVGAHVPRHLAAWLTAWLGLIGVAVLGATNLFFLSKRYGRRLAAGRLGAVVHLNPERLARAQPWLHRSAVFPRISGRPPPAFTVPTPLRP